MPGLGFSLMLLAAQVRTAGPAPAAPNPLLIAADNLRVPIRAYATTARPSAVARIPHHFGEGALTELRLGYCGWLIDTNGAEIALAAWQIDAAAIELNGTTAPVTFAGARTATVASGQTLLLSDPILPSAVGLASFPASGAFFERVKARMLGGGQLPQNAALAQAYYYPTASDNNNIDATGGLNIPTGFEEQDRAVGACLIVGRYAATGRRAVIATGTSISTAFGDSGADGFVQRALHGDGTNTIAGAVMSASATTAGQYGQGSAKRRALMAYANVLHDEYGTNDIADGTQTSGAAVFAVGRNIWRDARAAGVQRVVKTTIHARTTSTDGWATRIGQTPVGGFGAGGIRDAANALYAASAEIDAVADQNAVLGDAADISRWKSPASTPAAAVQTGDGVHPADHAAMAAASRAAILSVAVDANAAAPVNLAAPVITTGIGQQGQPITLDGDGVWKEAYKASFTYQWTRGGVAIAGATAASYTPVAADVGATIARVTTATTSSGAASVTTTFGYHVWPAFGTRYLTDTMSGTGLLTAHTGESGHGWTSIFGADAATVGFGFLSTTNGSGQTVRSAAVAPGADQVLYINGECRSTNASQALVFVLRSDGSNDNHWQFVLSSNAWAFGPKAGGSYTPLASGVATGFSAGQRYSLAFATVGDAISIRLNGATLASATSAAVPSGGRLDIYQAGVFDYDGFVIDALAANAG